MPDIDFEQVKKLAEQLSPEDRYRLWRHLAGLIGLQIKIEDIDLHGQVHVLTSPGVDAEEDALTNDWEMIYSETRVDAVLRGRPIFQLKYGADDFKASYGEQLISEYKVLPKLMQEIRALYTEQGLVPPADEEIIAECRTIASEQVAALTARTSEEISARLRDLTWLFVNATVDLVNIAIQKSDRGEIKLDQIQELLGFYWQRIKGHLGVTHGGKRERQSKHVWTDAERECLRSNHERLKPIWRDANSIARAARASRQAARRERWREAVRAAYDELPNELIERLSASERTAISTSDLALIHAGRLCQLQESLGQLRTEIRVRKPKNIA